MGPLSRQFSVACLFLTVLALPTPVAHAATTTTSAYGFTITVEPILGYQYMSFDTPTPRRGGMLIYGVRASAGRPHIAGEAEYTRGTTTEGGVSPVQSVATTQENISLGVRGSYSVSSMLDASLRLGGQASKFKDETLNTSGLSSSGEGAWQIHPYLGAGLQLALANAVSAGVEANYIFCSLTDYTKNTVQLATSLRINFNAK
ncbi:MAG: hypothetical protein JST80_03820 [Bdellovibrionales bacterium]|nr:hypothetical protein [Bdellovibrionales bacterium]